MTWEYMTLTVETGGLLGGSFDADALTSRLNELGAQGWALVSSFDTNMMRGRTRENRRHPQTRE